MRTKKDTLCKIICLFHLLFYFFVIVSINYYAIVGSFLNGSHLLSNPYKCEKIEDLKQDLRFFTILLCYLNYSMWEVWGYMSNSYVETHLE